MSYRELAIRRPHRGELRTQGTSRSKATGQDKHFAFGESRSRFRGRSGSGKVAGREDTEYKVTYMFFYIHIG